jgi:ubiquinone/menaquinone biosynthesis C-methylase UbiE
MTSIKDSAGYYDAFSDTYEDRRHAGYHLFLDQMECAVLEHVSSGSSNLLEVGCGTGLIMQRILARVGSVVGCDLSLGMLHHAQARGLRVSRSDAACLPFHDESFDVVYSFKVLAHIPPIRETLAEVHRVLRPGGRAVLEFYNRRSFRAFRKRIVRGRVAPGVREDQVYTRYDSLSDISGYLPPGLEIEARRGIMVLTPGAPVHAIPVVGSLVRALERLATQSPIGRFGGFLSVIARKSG